jgi:hypothetical protein
LESESTVLKKNKYIGDGILTTEAELSELVKAGRLREKTATKIREARYDRRLDSIVTVLSTGSTLTVPRALIPGFAKAAAAALRDLAISSERESLWSDTIDDGVLLEQLVVLAVGKELIGELGGSINASKRSPARAAASRANGHKGGRPRKTAA